LVSQKGLFLRQNRNSLFHLKYKIKALSSGGRPQKERGPDCWHMKCIYFH
jgi:hypothetical protein